MKDAIVWFYTDNSEINDIAETMNVLGLKSVKRSDLTGNETFSTSELNILVIDYKEISVSKVIDNLVSNSSLNNFMKILVVDKEQVKSACNYTKNIMYLEIVERPLRQRELTLILEKSVIVEKYRDIMKDISHEAEERIEAFESLVRIHKKDMFENEQEKEVFHKIIEFEKSMLSEQVKLNEAIKTFSISKQKELFEVKTFLHAEQMLDQLRHKELLDANDTIKAQEAVLEFSSHELRTRAEILEAHEKNVELGREEAKQLHLRIKELELKIKELSEENEKLKNEIQKK
ncbi:MAG: hypothetical protein JW982_13150 [Spirochaetes bacterium]|nr:hypothetical protein [Spirochaetota bacterium]